MFISKLAIPLQRVRDCIGVTHQTCRLSLGWYSRGAQNGAWNAVTQDISGDSTYIPVLKGGGHI